MPPTVTKLLCNEITCGTEWNSLAGLDMLAVSSMQLAKKTNFTAHCLVPTARGTCLFRAIEVASEYPLPIKVYMIIVIGGKGKSS